MCEADDTQVHTAAEAADFQRRSAAMVAALRAAGLEHYVVATGENIFYFTGATFHGTPAESFHFPRGADLRAGATGVLTLQQVEQAAAGMR